MRDDKMERKKEMDSDNNRGLHPGCNLWWWWWAIAWDQFCIRLAGRLTLTTVAIATIASAVHLPLFLYFETRGCYCLTIKNSRRQHNNRTEIEVESGCPDQGRSVFLVALRNILPTNLFCSQWIDCTESTVLMSSEWLLADLEWVRERLLVLVTITCSFVVVVQYRCCFCWTAVFFFPSPESCTFVSFYPCQPLVVQWWLVDCLTQPSNDSQRFVPLALRFTYVVLLMTWGRRKTSSR